MDIQIFAENMRHLRQISGKTQSEIAASIGFSRSAWGNYELGVSYPKLADLEKIAKYFGILESDLLHLELAESDLNAVYERYNSTKDLSPSGVFTPLSAKKRAKTPSQVHFLRPKNDDFTPKNYPQPYPQLSKPPNLGPQDGPLIAQEAPVQYSTRTPRIVTVDNAGEDNILYVPVKARAGYLLGFEDPQYVQQLPTFRLPGLSNATYRMFEVEGLSMSPTLSDRDRVIAEYCPSIAETRDNRLHVIVLRDGILVKRLLNRVTQRNKLYLKSDTITHRADYPMMEIDPEDILELWYVNLKLSSDLSEPSELYTRVADLEVHVHELLKQAKK